MTTTRASAILRKSGSPDYAESKGRERPDRSIVLGSTRHSRHTHSSLLVDMGAPVSVAQAQLRHEDPSVTLGTYSHVLGDSQREYAEKVAELLDYSRLQKHGATQLIQ